MNIPRVKKIGILLVITLLMLAFLSSGLCLFAGCGNNKYNAELYDSRNERLGKWIDEDFLNKNLVRGPEFAGDLTENPYPESRTFIIKSQEAFDQIFIQTPQEQIDFEKEMIIIYTFTAYYARPIYIKELKRDNDTLIIKFRMKGGVVGHGDATQPYQRYLFVKLDSLDITTTQIELKEEKDRLF